MYMYMLWKQCDKVPFLYGVQCFSQWSGRDPNSLSVLLQELLFEYRSHHRALACQHQRLNFEMQALLEQGQFEHIDVHCSRKSESVSRFKVLAMFLYKEFWKLHVYYVVVY